MVTEQQIQSLADEIVRQYQPERIILVGSYAYGTPREDSDVDLLVVMPFEGSPLHKSVEVRRSLRPPHFSVDLIARTPDDLKRRVAWNDWFLREVVERGRVLYAARNC